MGKNIIDAKITPPSSSCDYVSDIWQEKLLNQKKRIIVLCANDGYGKTSCMAYCSEKMSEQAYCAWYLLDCKDNQLEQFITYLSMAFEKATGKKFVYKGYYGKQEKDLLELIYQFFYELEQLDRQLIFFFDEIQNIVDHTVLCFFDKLIGYTRDKVRFFFAGTERLPSFLIKYLSSCKDIVLLTENDLRMKQEQIKYILEKKGIPDKSGLASVLCYKTQGIPLQVMTEMFRLVFRKLETENLSESIIEKNSTEINHPLFVRCLGEFYAESEKRLVWRTKKCSELFAYLFSRQGRGVSSERITDILWEEKTANSARTLFYTTLSYLRKELEQAGYPDIIYKKGHLYYMNMKKIVSDYETICQTIQKTDKEEIDSEEIEKLVSLYTGRYMEGIDGDWVTEYRENIECLYLKKIREISWNLMENQRYEEAVLLLKKGLSIDNYSEAVSELLITCYIRMGEGKKAVEEYERIKELLYREFGVGVSENLKEAYQLLLSK